jgi:sarcosine oxidase, subunit beta
VRIAIIGAGVTGLSVAFHLAESGADVVVYERSGIGAEASGLQPGGVRRQWSTLVNCLLAEESVAFYRSLSERLEPRNLPTLEACGYVFLAHSPERLAALADDVALQRTARVPSQLLTPEEVAAVVPGLDTTTVLGAAYCDEDGYFDKPQAVVEAFAEACQRRGVVIEHAAISAVLAEGSGWTLATNEGQAWSADAVVLATGCDTASLLAPLEIDLPIVKQPRYLLYSEPIQERLLEPLVVSSELRFASKQLRNGRVLASDLGASGDPDEQASVWRANVKEGGRKLLPALEYVTYPVLVEGYYDVTPDHQPVIGQLPGQQGLWLAAGFSGHGFMIAPAVGRILADALIRERLDSALDSFAPERFAHGHLRPELQIV